MGWRSCKDVQPKEKPAANWLSLATTTNKDGVSSKRMLLLGIRAVRAVGIRWPAWKLTGEESVVSIYKLRKRTAAEGGGNLNL
mgnify:FL=1